MKAAQIQEFGDVSVVRVNDIPKPIVHQGQILIEVYASSLNPFDTKVREGHADSASLPLTLGGDIAGVVVGLGSNVQSFKVGDRVYGEAGVLDRNASGAFAEYCAVSSKQVAHMPDNIDFAQAATLPLAGASAVQAIMQHIALQPKQKIFIHGGAGGIGSIAIQIAKHIGAHVASTATGEGLSLITQLGVDEPIDYKAQDFAEILKDYDAVFDTVGGGDFNKSLEILKPGGIAVSMTAQADQAKVNKLGITAISQITEVTTEKLDTLRELVETSIVTAHIGKVFPLSDIHEAFQARESGNITGKVVLQIKI